ncbi:hypothetical protein GOBAR_DD16607 [Gossypium barbadense]|nr:hypothetical protein GOBAR_DD16607 [Gossypium barbadense]
MVGQNLFQISFEDENDLPWLFRRQLIIFDRLKEATKRSKIKLIFSPFWLRIGPCPPECEKKNLMHVVGSTFGGILRSEIKNEACQLKVQLDAQKPLRSGIFIAMGDQRRVWLPFKYKSLQNFCIGFGRKGHVAKECTEISKLGKEIGEDAILYSLALKAESNLIEDIITCKEQMATQQWQNKLQNVITPTDLGHARISSKSENSKANNQGSLELIESGSTDLKALFAKIEQRWETTKARTNTIATEMEVFQLKKKFPKPA